MPASWEQGFSAHARSYNNVLTVAPEHLLVKTKIQTHEKTEGGIYIPETSINHKKVPTVGVIVAMGDGMPEWVEVGDTIFFVKYGGVEVTFDDDMDEYIYKFLKTEHIISTMSPELAVVEELMPSPEPA